LRLRPLGRDPAALLEALEGGVERAVVDEDVVARRGLNRSGDALTVRASPGEGAQDEQVKGTLEQGLAVLGRHTTRDYRALGRMSTEERYSGAGFRHSADLPRANLSPDARGRPTSVAYFALRVGPASSRPETTCDISRSHHPRDARCPPRTARGFARGRPRGSRRGRPALGALVHGGTRARARCRLHRDCVARAGGGSHAAVGC